MPATIESPTASTSEEFVVTEQNKLSMPVVEHLHKAGLIANDDDRGTLTVLKRVNHAMFANEPVGDIPKLQAEFRQKLAEVGGDIVKLTEGGAESPVFKLNQAYLRERYNHFKKSADELIAVAHPEMGTFELSKVIERARAKAKKYKMEHDFLATNPDIVNKAVAAHPDAFDQYHNIGELLLLSGLAKGDATALPEKIDDVMAEVAATRLLDIAPGVMSVPTRKLNEFGEYPEGYKPTVIYLAEDTALGTTGLERLNLFDTPGATPEVKQIQALNQLLSAHLHAITSHERNQDGSTNPPLPELAKNLAMIPGIVRGYQMAGASLAHHFLTDGASAADAKMQSLDANFTDLAEQRRIPLVGTEEAQRNAAEMVEQSATFLREKFAGKPELLAKVDTLVTQATGQTREKGFAAKIAAEKPAAVAAAR